jgi:hypothetical protein
MNDEIVMFDSMLAGLIWLARDIIIVTLMISGLVSTIVTILNKLKARHTTNNAIKLAWRRRLVATVIIESTVAIFGCFVWDRGLLFNRLQATGLLILSSLSWISVLFVRKSIG